MASTPRTRGKKLQSQRQLESITEDMSFVGPSGQQMIRSASADEQEVIKPANIQVNNTDVAMERRTSCHRCGNIRKKNQFCPHCPQIFCTKCVEKMIHFYGPACYEDGCPVCLGYCCCANKSINCTRPDHCYKKCPVSRAQKPKRMRKSLKQANNDNNTNHNSKQINNNNNKQAKKLKMDETITLLDGGIFNDQPLLLSNPNQSLTACGPFFFQPSIESTNINMPLDFLFDRNKWNKADFLQIKPPLDLSFTFDGFASYHHTFATPAIPSAPSKLDVLHQEIFRQNEDMICHLSENYDSASTIIPSFAKPITNTIHTHVTTTNPRSGLTVTRNASATDMLLLSANELQNDRDLVTPSKDSHTMKSPVPSISSPSQEQHSDRSFDRNIAFISSPTHVFQSINRLEAANHAPQNNIGNDLRSINSSPFGDYLTSILCSDMYQPSN